MDDQPAILDQSVLDELNDSIGGDPAFIADLVATYLAEAPGHMAAMRAAADAGDSAAIVPAAHTLKSSSASLGAMRLAAIARDIELAGRQGETEGLAERVAAAEETWHATQAELKRAGLA
jgi:HPt (histidine-containing phosphotransfer) domain-containing protein